MPVPLPLPAPSPALSTFATNAAHAQTPPPNPPTLSPSWQTFMANGGFGMSAVTALTAQNSTGVQAVHTPPAAFLGEQLDSLLSDLPPAAIKTGMLPDAASVAVVAAKLREHYDCSGRGGGQAAQQAGGGSQSGSQNRSQNGSQKKPPLPPLVVDPVMISTSGHALADGGVARAVVSDLIPLATLITPNMAEAEVLCGAPPAAACVRAAQGCCLLLSCVCCARLLPAANACMHTRLQPCIARASLPAGPCTHAAATRPFSHLLLLLHTRNGPPCLCTCMRMFAHAPACRRRPVHPLS